jgi:hypothetical protein
MNYTLFSFFYLHLKGYASRVRYLETIREMEAQSRSSIHYYTAVGGGRITRTAWHSMLAYYRNISQGLFSMVGFSLLVKLAKRKSLGSLIIQQLKQGINCPYLQTVTWVCQENDIVVSHKTCTILQICRLDEDV